MIELPSDIYHHSIYIDALINIKDPEVPRRALALLEKNGAWATMPGKWKSYEALLLIVIGYEYIPSIQFIIKSLNPSQPKNNLRTLLHILKSNISHNSRSGNLPEYAIALKPSIIQLISNPNVHLTVKEEGLSLIEHWKIKESGNPLLSLIIDPTSGNGLILDVTETLVHLNDSTIAAGALALLQQNKNWLYEPEKEKICQALLSIILRYAYMASLSLVNDLLRPDQPDSWKENILSSLITMYNTKTVSQVALNNYCKPLKKSVFLLTDHSNDDIRAKSLSLYCYMVQTGDVPTREAIVRKFLQSDRESDWVSAVHAISKFDLRNLAADACQFYQTTVDPALRWQLQKSFDRWEYPCR